jgi:hypothetical protein
MFKTSDLEKVLNHLKSNDINEFEINPASASFASNFGMVPISVKFCTDNFDLKLMSKVDTGHNIIENQVMLIKREKL